MVSKRTFFRIAGVLATASTATAASLILYQYSGMPSSAEIDMARETANYLLSFQGSAEEVSAYAAQTLDTFQQNGVLNEVGGLENQLEKISQITKTSDPDTYQSLLKAVGENINETVPESDSGRGTTLAAGIITATAAFTAAATYFGADYVIGKILPNKTQPGYGPSANL